MTAFSCTPPSIPHIEGFELEMLKPSVFEEMFPEIKIGPDRVIATTALGAIICYEEGEKYVPGDVDDEGIVTNLYFGVHDRTTADRTRVIKEGLFRNSLTRLHYLHPSPGILADLGERFGLAGDIYTAVYCDNHDGQNKAIGPVHYAGHLAKETPEFPMASRYRYHIQHDSQLSGHPLGMLTIDTEARRSQREHILTHKEDAAESTAEVHAFEGLTNTVGDHLFYIIRTTEPDRLRRLIQNSNLDLVHKMITRGKEIEFMFALSRFTEHPLPNILKTNIQTEGERIQKEIIAAMSKNGIPRLRHIGLSEQSKAILELVERIAEREKQIGRVIIGELEVQQAQSDKN